MRPIAALLTAALLSTPALPAAAQSNRAGQFDYYVVALSWSPSWCRGTGDKRGARQCDTGGKVDFVLHGLWPQYEKGWPQNCRTNERDPSRRESQAMADVMGSGGLAWYQWQKHGRCSGLSAQDYYQAIRDAAAAAGEDRRRVADALLGHARPVLGKGGERFLGDAAAVGDEIGRRIGTMLRLDEKVERRQAA